MTTTQDTKAEKKPKSKRDGLSPDGKWQSFPKVPNLLQYVSTGLYFARVKVNGKLIRRSLTANTFEEAKLALHDFISKETKKRHSVGAPVTVGEARSLYESSLENDHTLSPKSLYYRKNCIKRLFGELNLERKPKGWVPEWPGLKDAKLRSITRQQCEAWSSKLAEAIDAQYFNNVLGTFKAILKRGGIADDDFNPLAEVKRMGIRQTGPQLPEPEQFTKIIELMETSGAGQQQECADFARFLAFSGCRLSEARAATWADVNLEAGVLTVHNAKVRRARNWKPTRNVPIIPDMRQLLERLKKSNPQPTDPICSVGECEKSLARACKLVGIPRLTHHDLRHLFASVCIESEIDIPTISRWLGHADGGALAMKVYGHLREHHSNDMAKNISFSRAAKPLVKEVVA